MKIYLLTLCCLFAHLWARKLIMIQCITRHGVRYPQYPNEYDFSNITIAHDALKELTAEGRRMHFLLGRKLYQKYWNALFQGSQYQHQLNRSLIYAKSTDTNRTIQSLENILNGFLAELQPQNEPFGQNSEIYPPFQGDFDQLQKDKYFESWQKTHFIPIHVEKGMQGEQGLVNKYNEGDFLVKQEHNFCPNQQKWEEQAYNSEYVRNLMENPNIKKAVKRVQQFFPDIELNFKNIYKYIDNYACLKAMGRPYLHVFEQSKIKQYIKFLIVARLYVAFLFTQTQVKTFSKTLIQNTIKNMKNAIQGSGPKVIFYSGHDSTLGILLSAMNFTNLACLELKYLKNITKQDCYWEYPHFASSFVFELWEEDSSYTIDISINGKKYAIPVCNNQNECELQNFESWFNTFTLKTTPNEECGVYQNPVSSFSISPILYTILVFVVFFILYRRCSSKHKYDRSQDQILSEQDLDRL